MTSYLKCHVCKHNKDGCNFGHLKNYKNYKALIDHVKMCGHIDCRVPAKLIIDSFKINVQSLKKRQDGKIYRKKLYQKR